MFGFEAFDAAAISQLFMLILAATGFTGLVDQLIEKGRSVTIPPMAKQGATIVVGIVLAVLTGNNIDTILPAGTAGDGALAGLLATIVYKYLGKAFASDPTP